MKAITFAYLHDKFRSIHPRTKKVQLNTVAGLLIKGGGMLISLLLVPLTIDYLSKETYGTWLTISSVVTMMSFLDIGIGNGLRNKFSEAVANKDTILARAYVSTSYSIFSAIQLLLITVFLCVCSFVPWSKVFNTKIDIHSLQLVIVLTVIALSIKLVLDIVSYILFALQETAKAGFITLLSNIIILLGTYILKYFTNGELTYLAAISAFTPVIVLMLSSIVLFRGELKKYRPSWQLVDLKHASSLLSIGYKFFVIQIAVIVIFYTDNLIITQLFGPAEVTVYNVAFRYFNSINTIFAIAIAPYWSAFTEAYVKGDMAWMKKTYNYLQKIWMGLFLAVVMMIIASNYIYYIWVGDRVTIPTQLNICIGLFVVISCWNNVTVAVINGLGK